MIESIGRVDDAILTSLNGFYGRWPTLDQAAASMTDGAMLKFGVFVAMIIWLWFKPADDQVGIRKALVVAVAAGLVAMLVARVLALNLPFRERPFVRAELGLHFYRDYDPGLRPWSAFPSDHAVLAFALSMGIWRVSKAVGVAALIYGLLAICLPRLYMGLHHPSDIAGGALIGIAAFWLFDRSRISKRISDFALTQERRRPQAFYLVWFLVLIELSIMFENFRSYARAVFEMLRRAG